MFASFNRSVFEMAFDITSIFATPEHQRVERFADTAGNFNRVFFILISSFDNFSTNRYFYSFLFSAFSISFS
jgi:hypothetical protein